jgi:hypothetical protein
MKSSFPNVMDANIRHNIFRTLNKPIKLTTHNYV